MLSVFLFSPIVSYCNFKCSFRCTEHFCRCVFILMLMCVLHEIHFITSNSFKNSEFTLKSHGNIKKKLSPLMTVDLYCHFCLLELVAFIPCFVSVVICVPCVCVCVCVHKTGSPRDARGDGASRTTRKTSKPRFLLILTQP